MESVANPDGSDPVRPEGLFRASNDPDDARDIFEDIVGEIQDTGEAEIDANATEDEFILPNETLDLPGIEFNTSDELETGIGNISLPSQDNVTTGDESGDINTSISASGGAIEEIYELRMNMTSFEGGEEDSYSIGLSDADEDGNEDTVWKMTVEIDPYPEENENIETQVRFESDIEDDLNAEFNSTTANLSEQGYVKMDLINEEFEMHNETEIEYEHPDDYNISEALEVVNEEASGEGETGDGIAVETEDVGGGEANGTFALDLMPLNGNFSRIADGELDFGGDDLDDVCDEGEDGVVTCGVEDDENDPGAYASAQIKEAVFRVVVEGPSGESERELR